MLLKFVIQKCWYFFSLCKESDHVQLCELNKHMIKTHYLKSRIKDENTHECIGM